MVPSITVLFHIRPGAGQQLRHFGNNYFFWQQIKFFEGEYNCYIYVERKVERFHLWKVFTGQVVLEGGETLDRHLHVVRVHVPLVHCDLLPGVFAYDVHLYLYLYLHFFNIVLTTITSPPTGSLYSSVRSEFFCTSTFKKRWNIRSTLEAIKHQEHLREGWHLQK